MSIEGRVANLGGRPRSSRATSGASAWLASLALHVTVALLAFLVTWTVVARSTASEPPIVTVLDFRAPVYDPVMQPPDRNDAGAPSAPAPATAASSAASPVRPPAEALKGLDQPLLPGPATPGAKAMNRLDAQPKGQSASFAGLRSSNARRIVYVVDASGSLVGTFPAIARELASSLSKLDQRQSFAVIFFQRNKAVPVPPATLLPASPGNVATALTWIRDRMIPAGRSNPLAALEAAMKLEPDLIFLLSADITGAGEFEISAQQLLDAVDQLNPASPRSGRRRVKIQCVEFLDRDPEHVLERLADIHGGPGAFRFLSRDELGFSPPKHQPGVVP